MERGGFYMEKREYVGSREMSAGEADQWATQYEGTGSNRRKIKYTWGNEAWKVLRVQGAK